MDAKTARTLRQLAETGWLAEQPPEFQARVAAIGHWVSHPEGVLLYAEDQAGRAIYGLGEGLLDIEISVSPTETVMLHRAPRGFWIGDSAMLAGAARTVAVRTAMPSRVFHLPAEGVQRLLREYPAGWVCFYRLSHANVTLALRVLAEVLSLRSGVRSARLLLRLAGPDGQVRATQDELGRLAGMSRAAFRRCLSDLITAGGLGTGYGGVRIADRAALEAAARGD